MANIVTDFETWILDEGDRPYRYLVYKKMFTPYEQKNAFVDEDVYEDYHYELCLIDEAIDLGNGEWLLGLRTVEKDGKIYGMVRYYKLSEIRLTRFESDDKLELYEEPDECEEEENGLIS